MVLPLIVSAVVENWSMTEAAAGRLASLELGAMAAGNIVPLVGLRWLSWRLATRISLCVLCAAGVLSAVSPEPMMLAVLRICAGLAGGVVVGLANAGLAQRAAPERAFAAFVTAQLVFGTAAMWALPAFVAHRGPPILFVVLAACALLAVACVSWMPEHRNVPREPHAKRQELGGSSIVVAIGIFIFFVGQGAFWAFCGRLGSDAGFEPAQIGFALGIASAGGLVGALLAMMIGTRFGRRAPLVLGTLAQVIALGSLLSGFHVGAYVGALAVFNLAWNAIVPFQLGLLSALDPSGRSVVLACICTGAGLAAGPALAGVLAQGGGYGQIILLPMALTVLSTTTLVVVMNRARVA